MDVYVNRDKAVSREKGTYYNGIQAMVRLIQQQQPISRKSKNPIVVQSMMQMS